MADTRERIVEEARDLYLTGGLGALSMRKVAERVGVSATALYRHFEDKESLLIAVLQVGFERFTSYLLRGLAGTTPAERLALTGAGYLAFALDNPAYYRIMFMTGREDLGYDRIPQHTREKLARSFQLLVDRCRECQASGDLRAGDPSQLALLIWSFTHGLVSLYLVGQIGSLKGDPDAFTRFYTEARAEFLAGLRP